MGGKKADWKVKEPIGWQKSQSLGRLADCLAEEPIACRRADYLQKSQLLVEEPIAWQENRLLGRRADCLVEEPIACKRADYLAKEPIGRQKIQLGGRRAD